MEAEHCNRKIWPPLLAAGGLLVLSGCGGDRFAAPVGEAYASAHYALGTMLARLATHAVGGEGRILLIRQKEQGVRTRPDQRAQLAGLMSELEKRPGMEIIDTFEVTVEELLFGRGFPASLYTDAQLRAGEVDAVVSLVGPALGLPRRGRGDKVPHAIVLGYPRMPESDIDEARNMARAAQVVIRVADKLYPPQEGENIEDWFDGAFDLLM